MSRRRNKQYNNTPPPEDQQSAPRRHRNTKAERPVLDISIDFLPDGKVEVDPKFNDALVEQLDVICGNSEEYDLAWADDHKIAYYVWTLMDGYLAQWDTPVSDDVNPARDVPHLKDSPVIDRVDVSELEILK